MEENKVPTYGDSQPATETPPQEVVNKIVLEQPTSLKTKLIVYGIVFLVVIGGGLFIADKVFDLFHKPNITASQTQMQNASEVQKIISLKSGFNISEYQAKQITKTMHDSEPGPNYKTPDRIVESVKGKDVQKEAEKFRQETKGDVVVTTDPNNPDKAPEIDKNKPYTLEQRSYKLYPDKQIGTTFYNDGSIAVDYDFSKVKVFKETFYMGVSVLYDNAKETRGVKYGISIKKPI